jgi:hypothetical protein
MSHSVVSPHQLVADLHLDVAEATSPTAIDLAAATVEANCTCSIM